MLAPSHPPGAPTCRLPSLGVRLITAAGLTVAMATTCSSEKPSPRCPPDTISADIGIVGDRVLLGVGHAAALHSGRPRDILCGRPTLSARETFGLYDAEGDFDRDFDWWESGKHRVVEPQLPFENGRSNGFVEGRNLVIEYRWAGNLTD